jgi:hypothetical protein
MSNGNRVLYVARFEIGQAGQDFQFPQASLPDAQKYGKVLAWMLFVEGYPYDVIELKALVGEISSKQDLQQGLVQTETGLGDLTPPMPITLFGGYNQDKIPRNYIDIDSDLASALAPNLGGGPDLQGLHWWYLVNFIDTDINQSGKTKFPYPGEFMALAIRLFMDRYWVSQETNPFLFGGNFLDTVYFTSGYIKEILPPTDEQPWSSYVVTWRPNPDDPSNSGEYILFPTDYSDYQVGDRVTIIKDVTKGKSTQLWNDDDMKKMGGIDTDEGQGVSNCSIAPVMFYGFDPETQEWSQGG